MNRLLLIVFLMFSLQVWATEPERPACVNDSTAADSGDIGRMNLTDDTLVFDDWESKDAILVQDRMYNPVLGCRDIVIAVPMDDLQDTENDPQEVAPIQEATVVLSVYPNPSSDWLHLQRVQRPLSMYVLSMNGASWQIDADLELLDIRAYAPGTYVLQLAYEDRMETVKFVKN